MAFQLKCSFGFYRSAVRALIVKWRPHVLVFWFRNFCRIRLLKLTNQRMFRGKQHDLIG